MKRILFILALIVAAGAVAYAQKSDVIVLAENQALPEPTAKKAVVIDFNATWCGPCRRFAPIFEVAAKKYSKKAIFVSVDVDKHPGLARIYGVRGIPYMMVLRKNQAPVTQTGLMPEAEFDAFLRPLLP